MTNQKQVVRSQNSEVSIPSTFLVSTDYWLLTTDFFLKILPLKEETFYGINWH